MVRARVSNSATRRAEGTPHRADARSDRASSARYFDEEVQRRHVIFCMGYDPKGPAFYYAFFRHQFEIFCNRFRLVGDVTSQRCDSDGISSHWDVRLSDVDWDVNTHYTFLRWDDLVIDDLQQPLLPTLGKKLLCDLDAITTGTFFRICWLNWRFGIAIAYPTVAILALMVLAVGIASAAAWGLMQVGIPSWTGYAVVPVIAVCLFFAGYRIMTKSCFLNLLVADGIFSMKHARGQRQDYLQRIDIFADRLVQAVQSSSADEIIVVGHSSGSFCAVEVMARALRKDPEIGRRRPRLNLLTVGANLPLIGCHPKATSFREDVSVVSGTPDVFWLEYQSPLDILSFPNFDPGRVLAEPPLEERQMNPWVHSAQIKESMEPRNFRRNRLNFWRLHFQFLMAVERLVPCDYMMIVAGPALLELRGTHPSKAIQLCYADAEILDTKTFRPLVPPPPGRSKAVEVSSARL